MVAVAAVVLQGSSGWCVLTKEKTRGEKDEKNEKDRREAARLEEKGAGGGGGKVEAEVEVKMVDCRKRSMW